MPTIVSRIVEVCVFRFGHRVPEFLLLQRAADQSVYPDIWQLVSGKILDNESARDAALREFREECGMIAEYFWVVPHASIFYDQTRDEMNISPMFAVQVSSAGEPKISSEHSEFSWLNYHEASLKLVWPGQREGMRIVQDYLLGDEKAAYLSRLPL